MRGNKQQTAIGRPGIPNGHQESLQGKLWGHGTSWPHERPRNFMCAAARTEKSRFVFSFFSSVSQTRADVDCCCFLPPRRQNPWTKDNLDM